MLTFDKQTNKTKIIGLYLPGLVRTQCPLSLAESQPEKCHWSSKAFSENIKIQKKKSKIKRIVFKDLQVGHLTSHRRQVHLLKLSLEGYDDGGHKIKKLGNQIKTQNSAKSLTWHM